MAAVGAIAPALFGQFPKSVTEPAAVERGAKTYASNCARCHGSDTRGITDGAPDLLRSTVVLHDRRQALHGKELAPYLKSTPPHKFDFNEKQADDLSQFLSASVNKILRSGYDDHPTHLTEGDAKAGEAYFNGVGGCAKCHSTTGDLAGLGKRYSAAALQQKFLFPSSGLGKKAPITAVVRFPNGTTATGDVVRIDDFTIQLRDHATGATKSFNRTAGVKVTTTNPYAAHEALLEKITDTDIHNLTTYLDTLQ
ncbi:c-type cytochrome [Terriglobus roseus]|uniref:Cytochrome c, mono-and diheme variants n=1 Tax=Terriglobus roseus TaxID=392734 RepID=A0A1H4PNU1_9BACT|nr:cytochrome c [Terriglobus roseus]SEC08914.1 Cytochrome c, mono-and diheme variants [Terriglobus roseus]